MKRTVISILSACALFLISTASVSAFDKNSIIHSSATSSDGEWTMISVLDDNSLNPELSESIWMYRTNAHWAFPFCLMTFKPQYGWSTPSVCYDKTTDSFLVYHHCYVPANGDGGIFEYTETNGTYSALNFTHSDTSQVSGAKLFSNDCGAYLVGICGTWTGVEDRNSKIFKVEKDGDSRVLVLPDSLVDKEFAHIDWRKDSFEVKDNVYRDIFFTTDTGIIALDVNETDWWYFDCVDETLTEFSTKEEAYAYDQQLAEKRIAEKYAGGKRNQLWEILLVVAALLIIAAVLVILVLLFKKRLSEKQKVPVIADLDTKERNRFVFGIQETERAKISRDIHDSVVQDIRVIRLETENLEVAEKSKKLQQKIEDIATDCIVKLRNICYNLAPAELANHTSGDSSQIELVSIINSLAQQFTVRTHVPCTVGVEDGFEYPSFEKETTQNIFRVVQEALNNIEKHSYATNVSVFIKRESENDKNQIVIYITDDGIGCKKEKLEEMMASKDHLGLRSMKDRMELIGGSIEFISDQDDGMEIKLMIPVKAE